MIYKFTDDQNRKLRIRKNPAMDGEVVGYFEPGEEFEAENKGHWLETSQGYVFAELCEPVEQTEETSALESMTLQDLKQLAKESGVKLKSGMKKEEIIEALLNG